MIIDLEHFLEQERPVWEALEKHLARLEESPFSDQEIEEIKELHYLYERTSADLARLATYASEQDLVHYLESLVARAYGEIHETRRGQLRFRPLHWFLRTFPQTFRTHARYFTAACLVMLAGSLFGGLALSLDPSSKAVLIPFPHLAGDPSDRVALEEAVKDDQMEGARMGFSAMLMTHNTKVSIFAMGLGMTYGIGTVILMFYNGVILGAVAVDYVLAGEGVFLTGWLLPHGSIEIPAILIAGQAGLLLASALFGRGRRQRMRLGDRLRVIVPDLSTLIGGVAVLLIWAGVVESFLSQYHEPQVPYAAKIILGVIELVALFTFLFLAGRKADAEGAS